MSKLLLVQVLRALAALAIAALHAQADAQTLAEARGQSFTPLFRLPWAAGVDVFFVISGFIMVHASRGLFGKEGARGAFLKRRLARIVPLYWAVTVLYLAVALAMPALLNSALFEPWPILASFLFIPFARPDGAVQPLYSLGWTLNFEMLFYALFAATIVWPRRLAVPALIAILTGLAALGRAGPWPQPIGFWTSPMILEFAFGLAIGFARAEGVKLGTPARLVLAAAGLALLGLEGARPDGVAETIRPFVWGLPAALIVAAAALGEERAGANTAVTRAAVMVGDASYALYLTHPFVIRGLRALAARVEGAAMPGGWAFVALALAGATIVALIVHAVFERPILDRVRTAALPKPSVP